MAILYAPGAGADYIYGRPSGGGTVGVLDTTVINGTYRTGSYSTTVVFHTPGSAPDALWLHNGVVGW